MRAAENHRVAVCFLERRGVLAHRGDDGLAERVAGLDQRHEFGACDRRELNAGIERVCEELVAPALDRELGRKQSDPAVAGRLHGRVRLGDDHRHDRDLELLLQVWKRNRRRRVARDDNHLHAEPLEIQADLVREALDLVAGSRAVREARVIAEIHEVLVRHRHETLVQHREPTDSRVEDADRT